MRVAVCRQECGERSAAVAPHYSPLAPSPLLAPTPPDYRLVHDNVAPFYVHHNCATRTIRSINIYQLLVCHIPRIHITVPFTFAPVTSIFPFNLARFDQSHLYSCRFRYEFPSKHRKVSAFHKQCTNT